MDEKYSSDYSPKNDGQANSRRAHTPLPGLKIILAAFVLVWQRRIALVRVSLIPAILMITLDLLSQWNALSPLLSEALYLPIFTLFAVGCHRVILGGDNSIWVYGLKRWTGCENRYIGWTLLMLAVLVLSVLLVGLPLVAITTGSTDYFLLSLVVSAPLAYCLCRLSLILPAAAINHRPSLKQIWKLSEGNGWRLLITIGLFPYALLFVIALLPDANPHSLLVVAIAVIDIYLFAVVIATVSLVYSVLLKHRRSGLRSNDR